MLVAGFEGWGLGFRVQGTGFGVQGSVSRVHVISIQELCSVFRVYVEYSGVIDLGGVARGVDGRHVRVLPRGGREEEEGQPLWRIEHVDWGQPRGVVPISALGVGWFWRVDWEEPCGVGVRHVD